MLGLGLVLGLGLGRGIQQKPLRKMMMSRKETIRPAMSSGLMRSPTWVGLG